MISIENASKTFITDAGLIVHALDNISLQISDGEIVSVVGPSGCGKSTLLKLIAGFEQPTEGGIFGNDGVELTEPGVDRGVVFQQPNLFPWLNVGANVEFAATVRGGTEAAEIRAAAEELIELVGLGPATRRYPHELSGGMQQRAQIARVLATSPDVVLMDEPFGALDSFTREHLQSELLRAWHRYRPTIVLITHSVEEALLVADRVVVMAPNPGRILESIEVPAEIRASLLGHNIVSDRDRLRARLRENAAHPTLVDLRHVVKEAIAQAHSEPELAA